MSEHHANAGSAALAPVAELAGYRATAREPVDLGAAEQVAADLLRALGADLESEHLRETPRRVAAAYGELLTPLPFSATTFPNDENYDELVLVEGIAFSRCACITYCRSTASPMSPISRATV